MDVFVPADERREGGRRSRGVLIPRRWYQVCGERCRKRRRQKSPALRGPRSKPLKPIARGMPGETGVTVVTTLVWFLFFPREAAGACERPAFPAPSFFRGERMMAQPGRDSRRGERGGVAAPRRPGQAEREPGPIRRGFAFGTLADGFGSNWRRWLWVPAFAGTTRR